MNVVANYLLTFNAAFVALLYAMLDTQFFEQCFGKFLKVFQTHSTHNAASEELLELNDV